MWQELVRRSRRDTARLRRPPMNRKIAPRLLLPRKSSSIEALAPQLCRCTFGRRVHA